MKLLPQHTESCSTQYYPDPLCLYPAQGHREYYNLPKSYVEQIRWSRAMHFPNGSYIVFPTPEVGTLYARGLEGTDLFKFCLAEANLNAKGLTMIPPKPEEDDHAD